MDEDVRILNRNFSVEVDTYIDSLTSGANKIIRALSEIERSNANKRLAIEYFEKKRPPFSRW